MLAHKPARFVFIGPASYTAAIFGCQAEVAITYSEGPTKTSVQPSWREWFRSDIRCARVAIPRMESVCKLVSSPKAIAPTAYKAICKLAIHLSALKSGTSLGASANAPEKPSTATKNAAWSRLRPFNIRIAVLTNSISGSGMKFWVFREVAL